MIVDFIRGALTVLFIMIVAGAIAYVGDRVGHQVGRKRLTLFGIRPRYTSTIVAVGTGMLIAFFVTLIAILASQEVKTAFFKLNQINAQIAELTSREHALESKVNNGKLVFPVDKLMVPFYRSLPQADPVDDRLKRIKSFYEESVRYINSTYPAYGLRPFTPPANIDKLLSDTYDKPDVTAVLMQSPVIMLVSSDQNLYEHDEIHFALSLVPDTRRIVKGQIIAQLRIPGRSNANPVIALNELQPLIVNAARSGAGLPPVLASNVQGQGLMPDAPTMQRMLSKAGTYVMTAYASEDVYPHTGGIPVVITLTPVR